MVVADRKLRTERGSVGDADGRVVYPGSTTHHVHRPGQHLAYHEVYPAEQTCDLRQPGSARHTRPQSACGELTVNIIGKRYSKRFYTGHVEERTSLSLLCLLSQL